MNKKISRRKLGMCNYCSVLGPVYEEENENGVPTFLICPNCINDVFVRLEVGEKLDEIERRQNMRWWINGQNDNHRA